MAVCGVDIHEEFVFSFLPGEQSRRVAGADFVLY
jgi:hypothetical protein